MAYDYTDSYWNDQGKHQELADELQELVPVEGKCENSRSTNKYLDKFRRAANCYYDLYNNGGYNRRSAIYQLTGVYPSEQGQDACMEALEPIMDRIILEAATEQGLVKVKEVA